MALETSREIGDKEGEAGILSELGDTCNKLEQYDEAIEHYTAALKISCEIVDKEGVGTSMGNLGTVYKKLGQYEKAVTHHTAALGISREVGDRHSEGSDLSNLGIVYESLGQYEEAAKYFTAAIDISRDIEDRQGEGASLGNLGIVSEKLGQYEEAVTHHTAALDFSREIGDREGEGSHLGNLGNVCERLGQYDEAAKHHTAALEISREIEDRRGEGASLGNLGNFYQSLEQHEEAAEHYTAALEISRETGDRQGEGTDLGNLGIVYGSLGQYDEAVTHLTAALEISREIGHREGEGTSLGNLGHVHLNGLGNPEAALPWLQQAVAVNEAIWDDISSNDGIDFEKDAQRVDFGDTIASTAQYLQLALFQLAQPEAALVCYERASSRAFKSLLAQQRGQTCMGSSESHAEAAHEPLDFSVLQAVAVRQQAAVVAFSQVSDEQVLVWVLGSADGSLTARELTIPEDDTSLSQMVELTRRTLNVRSRHNDTDRSTGASARHSKPVDEDALYIAAARVVGGGCTAAEMREALCPDLNSPLLARCIGEQPELGTAAAGEGVLTKEQKAELQQAASDSCLRRCHELLIQPINDLLANEPRLLLILSGDLFALPFAALRDTNGKHLIEQHVLYVAPSIGTIIELEQRKAAPTPSGQLGALVVGDPVFNHAELLRLKETSCEAEEIHRMLDQILDSVTVFKEHAATKHAVKAAMQSCSYIHLATHGDSDGLYFAAKSGECSSDSSTCKECKLSMDDVQRLQLQQAKLVVLSGCDTLKRVSHKGTQISRGVSDGVVGITRAFLAAGAPTVLASLWKVDDKATRALMRRFYRLLLGETAGDPAVALQQAMIAMINERFAVNEWASFVVYGLAHCVVDVDKARIAVPEELVSAATAHRSTDTVFVGRT